MPLLAAGRHMTRATREGGISTPSEILSAEQALRAVTIEAAWSLGLEDEIGHNRRNEPPYLAWRRLGRHSY